MTASPDQRTADRFALSWNTVYDAAVYTEEQFLDWVAPWTTADLRGKSVLELGCGSGALLHHMAATGPGRLVGVDLGASVARARALLGSRATVEQGDICDAASLASRLGLFERVYCIGVLHHLASPEMGVDALISMTAPGGRFHGWVYAHEGNLPVRLLVEPLRRLVSRLPGSLGKWGFALPLAVPFFLYAKLCRLLPLPLPMAAYMRWVGKRDFRFHHHVAFDQLVTPATVYIRRERVEAWLADPRIEPGSAYVIMRNGNGWKFGGTKRKGTAGD